MNIKWESLLQIIKLIYLQQYFKKIKGGYAYNLFIISTTGIKILREKSLAVIYTWVSHRRSLKH